MKAYLVYELYNREYDNCLLLQSALRHKGIETEIVYKMDLLKIPVSLEPRFFIIPNCYNDGDLEYYYYASGWYFESFVWDNYDRRSQSCS